MLLMKVYFTKEIKIAPSVSFYKSIREPTWKMKENIFEMLEREKLSLDSTRANQLPTS